jgi:hypothetical protein
VALVRRASVSARSDSAQAPAPRETAETLRAFFETRARAELAIADALAPGSDAVAPSGALLAEVVVVKGLAGPAEATGRPALAGPDGEAVGKALEALGWDPALVFATLSRPEPGIDAARRADRLRQQIEAVDPALVLALDAEAAADVAEAFGIAQPAFGEAVRVLGRRIVAVDGLEASLGEPARKRRVWRQLQAAKAEGPVY